jgi:hypothetical protein
MTTGRINQVTTFRFVGVGIPKDTLPRLEFINKVIDRFFQDLTDDPTYGFFRLSTYYTSGSVGQIPLYPDLTSLRDASPRPFERRSHPSKGTTSDHTTTADPHVVHSVRFGHRQAIHIPLHRRRTLQTSTFGLTTQATKARYTLLKPARLTLVSSSFDSKPGTPAIPHRQRRRTGRVKRPFFDLLPSPSPPLPEDQRSTPLPVGY